LIVLDSDFWEKSLFMSWLDRNSHEIGVHFSYNEVV
jgi:hypothetical protein